MCGSVCGGCTQVHLRISSPPVTDPCFYGMDFPSKEELFANQVHTHTVGGAVCHRGFDRLVLTKHLFLFPPLASGPLLSLSTSCLCPSPPLSLSLVSLSLSLSLSLSVCVCVQYAGNVEEMAKWLRVTSLGYLTPEGLVEAATRSSGLSLSPLSLFLSLSHSLTDCTGFLVRSVCLSGCFSLS